MIRIIVALDEHNLMGDLSKPNGMPWYCPEDLQHFKTTTLHQHIVMGHTTFQKLKSPLPKRTNIVVTHQIISIPNVIVKHSLNEIIQRYRMLDKDLYIIGGASIFTQALPYVDELLISRIPGTYTGNVYFPKLDQSMFQLKHTIPYQTFTLEIYQNITLR